MGARRVRRLIAQDSHIPEVAAACVPAQTTIADDGWDAFRRHRAEADLAPRPLRLLMRPEPIEAVAEVPDGPPLALPLAARAARGDRRRRPRAHRGRLVERARRAPARDYFRVEDKAGLRFWLFRAGLYRDFDAGHGAPPGSCTGLFA